MTHCLMQLHMTRLKFDAYKEQTRDIINETHIFNRKYADACFKQIITLSVWQFNTRYQNNLYASIWLASYEAAMA